MSFVKQRRKIVNPITIKLVCFYLIRHAGEVEIEPLDLLVEGADEQVVPARVDGNGGDPLGARHQLLSQLLPGLNYISKVLDLDQPFHQSMDIDQPFINPRILISLSINSRILISLSIHPWIRFRATIWLHKIKLEKITKLGFIAEFFEPSKSMGRELLNVSAS
jgi:hypothetical protein